MIVFPNHVFLKDYGKKKVKKVLTQLGEYQIVVLDYLICPCKKII